MRLIALFLLGLLATIPLSAQESWSLEKCLSYAQENNITIQQAELLVAINREGLRQAKGTRLPSLNAVIDAGINFGRTIDPATNDFINQSVTYNQGRITGVLPIWNANKINNTVKGEKMDLLAAELDLQDAKIQQLNAISLAYLQVMLSKEQVQNTLKSLELTQNRLEQTNKLIEAGALAEAERFILEAQLAMDQQMVISSKNDQQANLLNLKNLININDDQAFDVIVPLLEIPSQEDVDKLSYEALMQNALQRAPSILAAEKRVQRASLTVKETKALLYPSLNLIGTLSSNYSDAFQSVAGVNFERGAPQTIFVQGVETTVEFLEPVPVFQDIPYANQISDNFGQSIGIRLSVPIFNQLSFQSMVQQSNLSAARVELDQKAAIQSYQNEAQRLMASVYFTQAAYDAAEISRDAQKIAFENAEKRLNLGAINAVDYLAAKNNYEQAELNLAQAKYNFIYQVKLAEWSLGDFSKPIRFF